MLVSSPRSNRKNNVPDIVTVCSQEEENAWMIPLDARSCAFNTWDRLTEQFAVLNHPRPVVHERLVRDINNTVFKSDQFFIVDVITMMSSWQDRGSSKWLKSPPLGYELNVDKLYRTCISCKRKESVQPLSWVWSHSMHHSFTTLLPPTWARAQSLLHYLQADHLYPRTRFNLAPGSGQEREPGSMRMWSWLLNVWKKWPAKPMMWLFLSFEDFEKLQLN